MSITLRQLEIFIAVAETKQVTRASKKLYLTQSAVSMALGELENQLGGPLFDRHGRSLLLNDRGRYLLPLSKDIVYRINNIEAMLTENSDSIAGSLEVVASSTIGNYVLPYLIGAFMQIYPQANINSLVVNTRRAEELIGEGKMDLGFVEGRVTDEKVQMIPWFQDELVIIVNPSHALADQESFMVPEHLNKTTWVMREDGSGTAEIFKNKLGSHSSKLQISTKLGHTEAVKKAIESGAGAGCLSNLAVCREVEHGWLKCLPVQSFDMHRQLLIIHHKEKVMTRLMKEFLNFCQVMAASSIDNHNFSSPKVLQTIISNYENSFAKEEENQNTDS